MGQATQHYVIFETERGFCGIAWSTIGITRFQLPVASAEAAERLLLHRISGGEPGVPTPEVAEAAVAVKRYFEGEETDFSALTLDLRDQDAFFKQIYIAARQVGWGQTTTYGTLAKKLGAGPEAAPTRVSPLQREGTDCNAAACGLGRDYDSEVQRRYSRMQSICRRVPSECR